jgi:hypothetical protein
MLGDSSQEKMVLVDYKNNKLELVRYNFIKVKVLCKNDVCL